MNIVSCFVTKLHYRRGGMCWSVGTMEQPFFPPSQIRPFSSHCLSEPFHYIISLSSGQEAETHDKLCPHNKKT
jgi:hypothetical protein